MNGQLCLDAHVPESRNMYTHCEQYQPEGIQEWSTFIYLAYLLKIILMDFF